MNVYKLICLFILLCSIQQLAAQRGKGRGDRRDHDKLDILRYPDKNENSKIENSEIRAWASNMADAYEHNMLGRLERMEEIN